MERARILILAAAASCVGAHAAQASPITGEGMPSDVIMNATVIDFESVPTDSFPTTLTNTSVIDPRDGAATSVAIGSGVTVTGFDTLNGDAGSPLYVTPEIVTTYADDVTAADLEDPSYAGTPSGEFALDPYTGADRFNSSGSFLTNWDKFAAAATGADPVFQDIHTNQFRFDLDSEVSAFGFNFGANGHDWTLAAYTASGDLIEQIDIGYVAIDEASSGQYYGIDAGSNIISYLLLTDTFVMNPLLDPCGRAGCGDFVVIDNVTFGVADSSVVPVPAALPLMAGALGAFAVVRRRQRKAA